MNRDDLLVAVPDRDTMLVADANEELAVEALVLGIQRTAEDGLPITCSIYRWRQADPSHGLAACKLEPFSLPDAHPAAVIHHNLLTEERLQRYAEQHWPLQEVVGDELYVASAEADEAPDGMQVSRALWTERVDTLLPEVDRIHMLETLPDGSSSRMWVADFDALRSLPDALIRARCHLPRWRTARFPSASELRAVANPLERDKRTAELESGDQWDVVLATNSDGN